MAKKPFTIEQVSSFVVAKGFVLLSKTYAGNRTRLKIGCDKGHTWETTWKELQNGQQCPTCNWPPCPKKYDNKFRRGQLETAHKIAIEHGGKCLSITYGNNRDMLEFCCAKGHEWKTTYKNVVNCGSWCPQCLENSYLKIEDLKTIAIERGGLCLSDDRKVGKLRWQCCFGHEWEASVGNIVSNNSWCPICASGLNEEVCRYCLELMVGHKFPKSNPPWLKNRHRNQLHLDGFCEELMLAFEYQGEQHFRQVDYFHHDFQRTKDNDVDKAIACVNYGVSLICIPSLGTRLKVCDLAVFFEDYLKHIGIEPVICSRHIVIGDVFSVVRRTQHMRLQEELEKRAKKKAGLHGGRFLGMRNDKFAFECASCGHEWEICNICENSWCPNCATKYRRKTLDDARELATSKKGLCLSTEYVNNHTKMLWQCSTGHTWESTYNNTQYHWCPVCSNHIKHSLDDAKNCAIQKGGKCLSETYVNSRTRMLWQCASGHKWLANYSNIKNNHWCPVCSGRVKSGLP